MQVRLLFIEQNPIHIRVIQISRANIDARQAAATKEGGIPDAGDAIRNRDARQAVAVFEGPNPDTGDRIPSNGVGDHQFSSGCPITKSDGDFSVSRGVNQVAEVSTM